MTLLFGCQKAKIVPGGSPVESVSLKDINFTYSKEKIKKSIKIIKPLETNGDLNFNLKFDIQEGEEFLALNYDKEKSILIFSFIEGAAVDQLVGSIEIFNSENLLLVTKKIEIDINKSYLQDKIAELSNKLLGVKVTPDDKVSPEELDVHKKFMAKSNFKEIDEEIKKAKEVFENKHSTQTLVNEKEQTLKTLSDNFQTKVIVGTKLKDFNKGIAFLSVSVFFGIIGIALVVLAVVFVLRNNKRSKKKKNENEK